jgi:hypothetical protein
MWAFPTNVYESLKSFNTSTVGIQTVSDIGFYSPYIDGADMQTVRNTSKKNLVLAMKTPAAIGSVSEISAQTL